MALLCPGLSGQAGPVVAVLQRDHHSWTVVSSLIEVALLLCPGPASKACTVAAVLQRHYPGTVVAMTL